MGVRGFVESENRNFNVKGSYAPFDALPVILNGTNVSYRERKCKFGLPAHNALLR